MTTSSLNIKYPDFDDIVVSTKTFIVKTNLIMDLKKLFDYLPVTDYVSIPKKRGRKKKMNFEENNKERKDIKDEIENIKNKIQNIKENYVKLIKNQDDYYINSEFKKHIINDLSFPYNIYELYCFNRIY